MRKYLWIGITMGVVAVAAWIGMTTWRARANIVSLHVRKASLAEVIASLSRQSGELIVADTNLDRKITLDLKNAPLTEALQRVARQARALAGTVHALYKSENALAQLKTALQAGHDPERAGWSTLAPRLDGAMRRPLGEPEIRPGGPGQPMGNRQVVTEDVQAFGPKPGSADAKRGKEHEGAPIRVMRFQNSDAAGNVHTEIWSPERIVASTELADSLPALEGKPPSRRVAEGLAQQARARCTTFYALKQSLVPVDNLTSAPGTLPGFRGAAVEGNSNQSKVVRPDDLESRIRREKMSQYQELTPEQRVQRARQVQDHEEKR